MSTTVPNLTFAYEAQNLTGEPIRGTIEAPALGQAEQQLKSMGLHIMQVRLIEDARPKRPLGAADFLAFNQQLTHLTSAGLPLERGLRLIASDLRSGRLKRTIDSIASGIEQGQPLEVVFAQHRGQFSETYAKVVETGIRSSTLPAVLLNLGKQMDTERRLRSELIRAVAYPIMVLLAVGLLISFLGRYVFPQIITIYNSLGLHVLPTFNFSTMRSGTVDVELPMITRIIYVTSSVLGPSLVGISAVVLIVPLLWQFWPQSALVGAIDSLLLHLPLVGPVLRRNFIARWLDGLHVAVAAGMDLPNAIELANGATRSSKLQSDGRALIEALQSGRRLDQVDSLRMLPASVPPTLEMASKSGNLPDTLAALAESYQQQADLRIAMIPAILTPILMTIVALLIGSLILALLAPISRILTWMGHF